jgi:hypothetical protein
LTIVIGLGNEKDLSGRTAQVQYAFRALLVRVEVFFQVVGGDPSIQRLVFSRYNLDLGLVGEQVASGVEVTSN